VVALDTVAALDAAQKLTALHTGLRQAEAPASCDRLRRMDAQVAVLPFAVTERLLAPEQVIDELDEIYQAPARRLGLWRNLVALAPLLLTWFALALATFFYKREISSHQDKVTTPFMLLWEQRFGGEPVPRFWEIALLDAILILGILLLTWRMHVKETAGQRRLEDFRGSLAEALLLLAVAVEQHHQAMPMTAREWAQAAQEVVAKAARSVVDLERTLKESEQRSKDFLNGLSRQTVELMDSAIATNKRFVEQTVQETSKALREALDADRRLVNNEMAPLVERLRISAEEFARGAQTQRGDAEKFTRAVTDLNAAATSLATSAAGYSGAVKSIEATLTSMAGSQTQFTDKVSSFVDKVATSAESMITAAKGVEEVSKEVSGALRTDLGRISKDLGVTSGQLARVNTDLSSTSTALTSSAGTLRDATDGLAHQITALAATFGGPARRRRPFGRR
jgi:hypothetical protein